MLQSTNDLRNKIMRIGVNTESCAESTTKAVPPTMTNTGASKSSSFMGRPETKRHYRLAMLFHSQHSPVQNTPEYWQRVSDDIANLAAANGNDPFLAGLLLAVWEELERESGHINIRCRSEATGGA